MLLSRETLLSYPNFNSPFVIHTNASKLQLGAVDDKSIAFNGRNLHWAQINYTTTEQELLFIAKPLKEFRNILLGQQIKVYTDNRNLKYKIFNSERVMQWTLILEEYSPELLYVQGSKNIAADTLNSLDIIDTPDPVKNNVKSIN